MRANSDLFKIVSLISINAFKLVFYNPRKFLELINGLVNGHLLRYILDIIFSKNIKLIHIYIYIIIFDIVALKRILKQPESQSGLKRYSIDCNKYICVVKRSFSPSPQGLILLLLLFIVEE